MICFSARAGAHRREVDECDDRLTSERSALGVRCGPNCAGGAARARCAAAEGAPRVSVEHKRQQQQQATGDIDTAVAKSIGPLSTRKICTRLLRDAVTAAATRATGLPNEVGLSDSPDGEELLQTTSDGLPSGIDYQTLLGIPTGSGYASAITTSAISPSADSAPGVTSTSGTASIYTLLMQLFSCSSTAVRQQKHWVPETVSFGFSLVRLSSQSLSSRRRALHVRGDGARRPAAQPVHVYGAAQPAAGNNAR